MHMIAPVRVGGTNFQGSVEIQEDILKLEIVDFNQGGVFQLKLTTKTLQEEYTRYLVIKNLHELHDELTNNHKMFINEEGQLVIPIEVQYRGRSQTLKIQITLEKLKIENDYELNLIYLKQIARMSRQHLTINKYKEKLIRFKCDETNLNIKNFEIANNVVKYGNNNVHAILNHFQPLPKTGIHYFQVKIIKTYGKNLIFGICTNEVKSLLNIYQSPQFIGLNLSQRTILGNSKSDIAIQPVEIVEGKSVVKVEIDMNKGVISWYLDQSFLCARKIPREIAVKEVLPLISFFNNQDSVELIHQE